MQSINVTVITPWFLGVFLGTAVLCGLLLISTLVQWSAPGTPARLVGSGLYLVGTVAVTGMRNVPLNNALATIVPDDPDGARQWASYQQRWMV